MDYYCTQYLQIRIDGLASIKSKQLGLNVIQNEENPWMFYPIASSAACDRGANAVTDTGAVFAADHCGPHAYSKGRS